MAEEESLMLVEILFKGGSIIMKLASRIKTISTQCLAVLTIFGMAVLLVPGGVFAQTTDAVNDTAITPPGAYVDINVVANDTAGTGTFNLPGITNTNPTNGTLVNHIDGTFTYTPNSGFSGTDNFGYRICDNATPSPSCDGARVDIIVANEVNFRVIPQKLNVKKNGVLPVDIRSSEDFDVTTINPDTLTLQGVPPLRWNMGDKKLSLKFSAGAVVDAIGEVNDRDVVILQLTGTDFDGVAIFGEDPVIIINKVKDKPKK